MIYQMDVIPGDLWTVNCTVSTLTGRLLGQPAASAQDDIPDGRHPGRSVDRQLHGKLTDWPSAGSACCSCSG